MIRILIVDDHPVVRAGIKQIIQETGSFTVTGEVGTGRDVLKLIEDETFDVIVLDISLPDISGFEVLQAIKKSCSDIKVLVLSRHKEIHYAIRALKLGALGYLNKQNVTDDLIQAIMRVSQGRRYIAPEIADHILDISLSPEGEKPPHTLLSEREYEVFIRLSQGKTVSECAEMMYLSHNTISTYRQRILEKLHLKTNAQMMHYAMEHHLID